MMMRPAAARRVLVSRVLGYGGLGLPRIHGGVEFWVGDKSVVEEAFLGLGFRV
jgi:hypothetical protein